ncbi:MAG: transposase [Pseudomonadota bacterium]
MSKKARKTFSPEFKREAVEMLERGDKEAAQLARELGINRNQPYKWKDQIANYGDNAFPGRRGRPKAPPADSVAALKAENKRLQEENEILKKAGCRFNSSAQHRAQLSPLEF